MKHNKKKYDAIIIGSGIGGLCSAALLSMKGKKVLVLEKHFKIGGWTHTFRRKNYEWDVGIHYIGKVHNPENPIREISLIPLSRHHSRPFSRAFFDCSGCAMNSHP